MLLGRGDEVDRLDRLTAGILSGRSGQVLVVGAPGIGKTALLDVAGRRAARRGVRVLRARAAEGAADLPFVVLDDLHHAAGGSPPAESGVGHRAAALHDLLTRAAGECPTLLVVDDAHNADAGSLTALAAAVARCVDVPVGCLAAARPDPTVARRLAAWDRLDLAPLSPESAAAVLRSVLGVGIDPDVAHSLAVALQGLPLALHEAARLLSADQLSGRQSLPDPLPVAPALMAAWGDAIAGLTEPARAALIDLAVAGSRPDLLATLAVAAAWTLPDLDAAVEAGLVVAGTPPEFSHPLVRDVVLQTAPAALVRGRYAMAAQHAVALDLPPALVAGLLSRSVVVGDDAVATAIAGQAERAEALGHLDAACRAWATAARLSVSVADRRARAVRGVRLAARFDLDVADVEPLLGLLDGLELDDDAAGWVAWLRATDRADVDPHASLDAQWSAIEAARDTRPDVLPVLLWDAAMSAWTLGRADLGLRAAREVLAYEASGTPNAGRVFPAWTGRALLAAALIQAGQVAEGMALRREVLAEAASVDPALLDRGTLLDAVFLDDVLLDDGPDGARRLTVAEQRMSAAPEPLACLWGIEAWRARATGRWAGARALVARARPLADASGASGASRGVAALATELAGACDDLTVLTAQAGRLRVLTDRWGDRRRRVTHDRALGLRALLDGRLDDAVTRLTAAADVPFLGRGLRDGVVPARVDLVEAYLRRGEPEIAQAWRDRSGPVLRDFGTPLAEGLARRADALVADSPQDADSSYRAALVAHAGSPEAFEQGRTLLLYGEHLRRTHRRAQARPELAQAALLFDGLGAVPWRDRASAELRACGGPAPGVPATADCADALTPQERAVAVAVCEGRSNRETADLLSLSPRTVEHHLSSCYRKLGVRGRTGLAHALRPS